MVPSVSPDSHRVDRHRAKNNREKPPSAGGISDRIDLNFCTSGIIDVECRMLRLENPLVALHQSAEAAPFFKNMVSAPCETSPLSIS